MTEFITVLHIVACFALVAIVLLQHGKGADMGAAFGSGASNTVFGARGAGNFLTKLTTGAVVVFMGTSITLSYFGAPRTISDLVGDTPAFEAAPEDAAEDLDSAIEEIPTSSAEIEEIPVPEADLATDETGDAPPPPAPAEPPPSE